MPAIPVSKDVSTPFGIVRERRTVNADGGAFKDPTLAAAKVGVLTTRTSGSVGTLTMNPGHGIATANRLDVYWVTGARYGCVVGTVAGDSVPLTGGTGDDLPALNSAITAMVPQLEPFVVTAATMQMLCVSSGVAMWAVFRDIAAAIVAAIYVGGTNDGYSWDISAGGNPFAADVVDVYLSHGATSPQQTIAAAYVN